MAERQVIGLRYGLGGNDPQTRRGIASALGLTPARVRRTEADALAKLRAAIEVVRLMPDQGTAGCGRYGGN